MIILGIDPGLAITGYGIIKYENRQFIHQEHGTIRTPQGLEHHRRLAQINIELEQIIKKCRPRHAAVEELFMHKNVKTAIRVGEARGVILMTIAQCKVPMVSFTPLQIKQAITGYGRASKMQIQKMVRSILKLKEIPKPDDAADALAIAICLAQTWNSRDLK